MNSKLGFIKRPCRYLACVALAEIGRWLPARGIPILTYHSLDDTGSPISKSPEAFAREIGFLRDRDYTSLTLSDCLQRLSQGEAAEKVFVITFDDGFENVHRVAYPLLQQLGCTATVFVVTDFVGKDSSWEVDANVQRYKADRMPLMSWSQIREMHSAGFEFGSHTATHSRLTDVDKQKAAEQLQASRRVIEDQLAGPCQTFCYPYGAYNPELERLVRDAGYTAAVTTDFGRNTTETDHYRLKRIGSARFANGPMFKACIYGTYGWHLRGRQSF